MANVTYSNPFKQSNSQRYKINNDAVRMMAQNPSLGIGYIIGSMLGENYWGKRQNKSRAEANFMTLHPDATKEQFNQYYDAIKNGASRNEALAKVGLAPMREYGASGENVKYQGSNNNAGFGDMNKAFDTYQAAYSQTPQGKVLYEGRTSSGNTAPSADNIPRTPQQNGQKPVTTSDNGLNTVEKAWNNMVNGSGYNPGGTALYTNGVRNLNNVMPMSYTPEQLSQIAAQNLPPAEVQRVGAEGLLAPAVAAQAVPARVVPQQAVAPAVQTAPTAYAGDFRDALRGYVAPVNPNYDYIPGEGGVNDINAAGLALAQSGFSPAASTRAGAANFGNGYAMPGHDPNLEWHPFAVQENPNDAVAREYARKWLEDNINS